MSKSEEILAAARQSAQAHGYAGLNFRDLADEVGIKAASIYHHFPSKADLGAAVAKRYWQDTAKDLEGIAERSADPLAAFLAYPDIFRRSLERENRMCMCSFMSAEYDDLPGPVRIEVQAFADVNIAWLAQMLVRAEVEHNSADAQGRAAAIFAAVAGAQLMARSRNDINLFDSLIAHYQRASLLPS
ncbi:TetR/AcrR family transcriptional regulator [Novosphingobium sp. SG707]|uniref:TetR/AcrR family transcriptional regulator n=1 Tax=Novosphingobium sp. SG707 TaxID=2586996 RepID=UPI0014478B9B|nr:TetR/AcrR family transcriptional regulator [Novosphingobium sp. SG707]NKJ03009.1 TetR/AcrR family transcriptional repressor of nem operon [Novosphingobium sp. SG707]